MNNYKSGFATLLGRPNVGKSTLINKLIGEKITITSPVAQTTRNKLKGILTTKQGQIIFVDTPGVHKPHHLLGEILVKNAKAAINGVDLVILVLDSSEKPGMGDQYIKDFLVVNKVEFIVVLNKWDLVKEQVLIHTREEVPHSVAVKIEKIREIKRNNGKDFTAILSTIIVERKSQKGILIGKKGSMLKTIGKSARLNMTKLIEGPVHLELFVKVVPNWRKKESRLIEFGFKEDY